MSGSKGTKAIAKLAKQKGISIEEVRQDIEIALAMGMADPNPSVKAYWNRIPRKGSMPTPEEVIEFLAGEVKKKM